MGSCKASTKRSHVPFTQLSPRVTSDTIIMQNQNQKRKTGSYYSAQLSADWFRMLLYHIHSVLLLNWSPQYGCTIIYLTFLLEKAEEPETKLPTSSGSSKKQQSSRETSIFALLTMPKPWTVWITINCGKFWKRWEYQTTWPASWETCMQVRKQQLELDMKQQTGSK